MVLATWKNNGRKYHMAFLNLEMAQEYTKNFEEHTKSTLKFSTLEWDNDGILSSVEDGFLFW